MKKLITEIGRIKSIMGLITEDEVTFPIIKSGSYTVSLGNCDRLHAFNDTKSGPVGRMNDIINPILLDVYKKGVNPDITDVQVNIKKESEYTVEWTVTINESTDGNAWVGLYSRGHGGRGPWVFSDVSTTNGNSSIESCKTSSAIKKRGNVDKMVLVKDYEYNKDGKIEGCQVNQLFYKYTLNEYTPHPPRPKPKPIGSNVDNTKEEAIKNAKKIFSDLKMATDIDRDNILNDYDGTDESMALKAIQKINNKETLIYLNKLISQTKQYSSLKDWLNDEMSGADEEYYKIKEILKSLGYYL